MRHETRVMRQNILSRDKSCLKWSFSCRATLFECLRHNHLLQQAPMM